MFLDLDIFILFMCMGVLVAYMCEYQVCAWCTQEAGRTSDPLKLELQVTVSCHVGAGNRACVLWRAASV